MIKTGIFHKLEHPHILKYYLCVPFGCMKANALDSEVVNMSVLLVKMVGGTFCAPCVTHRRFRQFPDNKKVFDTQYNYQSCSVFHTEHDDMLFSNFLFS